MSIEAMRQALEALETNNEAWKALADSGDAGWWEAEEQPFYEISIKSITALCQAIEQDTSAYQRGYMDGIAKGLRMEQAEGAQPVAWYHAEDYKTHFTSVPSQDLIDNGYWQPLYTAPTQRQHWVGLTGDEVNEFAAGCHLGNSVQGAIRKAEAKLKEKNT